MWVQRKHMYTYTHTPRWDAAESHRHRKYKTQPFACIISEISQALLLHKTELFKTNMEKQDCTLKRRGKNKINKTTTTTLPVSRQIRFCFILSCSKRKFITLIWPHPALHFSNSQGDKATLKHISEYTDSSLTLAWVKLIFISKDNNHFLCRQK